MVKRITESSNISKKKNHHQRNTRKALLIGVIFLFIAVILAGGGYITYLYYTLPDPSNIGETMINQSTKIYDRTGEVLLYEIHGEEKRTVIALSDIPQHMQKATLAIEDAEFYQHPAFNWRSLVRAVFINLKEGRFAQGGSTITQQVVKNVYLTPEKTIQRKIKEILLALKLEEHYTKDQILEMYLNQIPYGSNAYGIEAAAQTFFNKSARDLTLGESAILAALPQAPSYYSPYGNNQKELFDRQKLVLKRMLDLGFITQEEYDAALAEKIKFAYRIEKINAPHFVMFIKQYLENKYGADYVENAGLKVITTLDWDLQQIAEKTVYEGAKRNEELYKGKNAALVAQDPKTGQILAMVGSRDYFDTDVDGNFNVITGHRQPGSSFKPFAYLTGFEKGLTPETVVFDLKTEFNPNCPATADGNKDRYGLDCYHPQNFDLNFRGPVDLRHALAQSINVPAVKVLYLAGIKDTIATAQTMGITTLTDINRYGLSLVLGGGDVKPLDFAEAYSVFAQDGVKHQQAAILKVEDAKGTVLEEYEDVSEQVIDPQYIRLVNSILSDKEARIGLFSPGNQLEIPGYEVAAKTGTTQDYRDAWTVGYTPSLVTVVWAGNNDFSPMQKGGGSILAAVPIWHNFMIEALKKYQPESFPQPAPTNPNKPVLRGEYIVNLKIGDTLYPQIHNILFWVDKNDILGPSPLNFNDPQANNWEFPITQWIQNNLPNPQQYNIAIPYNYAEIPVATPQQNLSVELINPQNGDYITGGFVYVVLNIQAANQIKSLQVYFNDNLVREDVAGNGIYQFQFLPSQIEDQNQLKVSICDVINSCVEKSVVVFKQQP
ncbi:MAG: PBP1A family penicillin-binding protein [Candidatus Pacebacteria bacterium]|nr:PBP1A family penicillin-binding protein [Candidatus Paceibacterota bacterium]